MIDLLTQVFGSLLSTPDKTNVVIFDAKKSRSVLTSCFQSAVSAKKSNQQNVLIDRAAVDVDGPVSSSSMALDSLMKSPRVSGSRLLVVSMSSSSDRAMLLSIFSTLVILSVDTWVHTIETCL